MIRRKPRKSEKEMGQATLTTLIDYYISDMVRRNCTADSIRTNRSVLARFARILKPGGPELRLAELTAEQIDGYVAAMQSRQRKWEDHPKRPPEEKPLSPFTVRKEVKILRGFGTWLEREPPQRVRWFIFYAVIYTENRCKLWRKVLSGHL